MDNLNRAALFSLAVMGTVAAVYWGFNRPVLSYGVPEASYLDPRVVRRGDVVQACFEGITWFRPMPGQVTQWFECKRRNKDGVLVPARFDMENRTIKYPKEPGRLPLKCRPVANDQDVPYPVPGWCEPGELRYSGFARLPVAGGLWSLQYELPPRMVAEILP